MSDTPDTPSSAEMNLGEQPLAAIMAERGLKAHDLVAACGNRITHKMVARACKGRRLTRNTQELVCAALNAACRANYTPAQLFNYHAYFRNRQTGPDIDD